jgi:hypothetical protein
VNFWRVYWLLFLLVGFAVPETIALIRSRRGDTLSEAVWHWCQVTPGNTMWTWSALHVFVALFMVWLFVHLMLGYWR